MDIDTAKSLSRELVEAALPHCHRVEVAGSVRRSKPTVKDIELVARVRDWEGLFAALSEHGEFIKPGVPDIQPWKPRANAKYLRMSLNAGVKLDLFVATEQNWGALFTMRTGGAVGSDGNPFEGFVPGMFSRWKRVSGGGRMLGCLPTLPDGRSVAVPEEEDFFRLCGIEWVPPEERTSKSAIKKIPKYVLEVEHLPFV